MNKYECELLIIIYNVKKKQIGLQNFKQNKKTGEEKTQNLG